MGGIAASSCGYSILWREKKTSTRKGGVRSPDVKKIASVARSSRCFRESFCATSPEERYMPKLSIGNSGITHRQFSGVHLNNVAFAMPPKTKRGAFDNRPDFCLVFGVYGYSCIAARIL